MEEVFTHINLRQSMMDNGIKIVKMALVFIHTQSENNLSEIGSTDRNIDKVHIITKMGINISEIG